MIPKREMRHHQHLLCVVHTDWGIKDVPITHNQEDINDLIREMALTKSDAELLIFNNGTYLTLAFALLPRRRSIVVFRRFSFLGMV